MVSKNKKLRGIQQILKDEIEVEKFKKLIKDMYRGFPNFVYKGMVEKVIIMDNVRDKLEEANFLIKEKHADGKGNSWDEYMLGPNALMLVSTWKSEELNQNIEWLTKILLAIGALTIFLIITQIVF